MRALQDAAELSPLSDGARRVWRLLLDGGGWWSAEEVQIAMGLEPKDCQACARWMVALANPHRKHALRRERRSGWQYAVTAACVPPEGETMDLSQTPQFAAESAA